MRQFNILSFTADKWTTWTAKSFRQIRDINQFRAIPVFQNYQSFCQQWNILAVLLLMSDQLKVIGAIFII